MLEYNKRRRKKVIESWVSTRKITIKTKLRKNRKRMVSLLILIALCAAVFKFVIPETSSEQYISLRKITPKNLKRISPEAFRKIIGYDYKEEIYVKDTAEIRARLEASNIIFGNVDFSVKLFPYYELEIKFIEAEPLFTLMPQCSDSVPKIYSDKGKIYPYGINAADLPVVDAKEPQDIALATKFLIDMRKNDALLYSRISQLIPSALERQITVFFNDVDFKTKFASEGDSWRTAFKHYRQLTRNMQVLNINFITVLDLRFKQLAYTIEKEERL